MLYIYIISLLAIAKIVMAYHINNCIKPITVANNASISCICIHIYICKPATQMIPPNWIVKPQFYGSTLSQHLQNKGRLHSRCILYMYIIYVDYICIFNMYIIYVYHICILYMYILYVYYEYTCILYMYLIYVSYLCIIYICILFMYLIYVHYICI